MIKMLMRLPALVARLVAATAEARAERDQANAALRDALEEKLEAEERAIALDELVQKERDTVLALLLLRGDAEYVVDSATLNGAKRYQYVITRTKADDALTKVQAVKLGEATR